MCTFGIILSTSDKLLHTEPLRYLSWHLRPSSGGVCVHSAPWRCESLSLLCLGASVSQRVLVILVYKFVSFTFTFFLPVTAQVEGFYLKKIVFFFKYIEPEGIIVAFTFLHDFHVGQFPIPVLGWGHIWQHMWADSRSAAHNFPLLTECTRWMKLNK